MAEEVKKFYRSRTDRVIFGVCGGLGKYFGVDPVLFRLLFVLFFFVDGAGILLYLIMVIVIPEEPGRSSAGNKDLEGEVNELAGKIEGKAKEISHEAKFDEGKVRESRNMLGFIIVLFGLFFLSRQILPMGWLDMDIVWALAIISIGFYIIFKK
ncbi:MAG: PspC domain-containing protein [Candidatus Pacebacteria bacterium]|jgi:phage shock protein PspC (stress-responsive transcriptional regulator)|nr:PspC domain-containing protein [Candidatus Paceibacterota bacterium]